MMARDRGSSDQGHHFGINRHDDLAWSREVLEQLRAIAESLRGPKAESVGQILHDIRWELQQQRRSQELYKSYVTREVLRDVELFTQGCQLSFRDTMLHLARTRCSFARFGDGELRMMLRPDYNLKFQSNSELLAKSLMDVLAKGGSASLLIGFPRLYRDAHWSGVWLDIWLSLEPLLDRGYLYGNSHVSRPIFFQTFGDEGVEMWRNLWRGYKVCVVTGKNSRFELLPQLFDTVADARYLFSTATNAFAHLESILEHVDAPDPKEIILVSLGPAGTVLTSLLSRLGHRALDIGHISDSYLNVFEGGAWPENVSVRKK